MQFYVAFSEKNKYIVIKSYDKINMQFLNHSCVDITMMYQERLLLIHVMTSLLSIVDHR